MRSLLKTGVGVVLLSALSSGLAPAGEIPAPAAQDSREQVVDLEARKASILVLENHIKEREARMGLVAADIVRIDQRLEGRIAKMVERLAGLCPVAPLMVQQPPGPVRPIPQRPAAAITLQFGFGNYLAIGHR